MSAGEPSDVANKALRNAMQELNALANLIERKPIDDTLLEQAVALRAASSIRTLLAALASDTQPASTPARVGLITLESRIQDGDCGCPEEMWDTPWGTLHMHLSTTQASNACLDNGECEREITVTTATIDEARDAFFGWAARVAPNTNTDQGEPK